MANRRCLQTLTHQLYKSTHHSHPNPNSFLHHLRTLTHIPNFPQISSNPNFHLIFSNANFNSSSIQSKNYRHFSSDRRDNSDEEEDEEEDEDDEDDDDSDYDDGIGESVINSGGKREYSPEEKEIEAAAIGYKVIGQLQRSDRVFKFYEPVFAVIQVYLVLNI